MAEDHQARDRAEQGVGGEDMQRIDDRLLVHAEEGFRRYKEHFVQPQAEFARRKAEVLQIDRGRIEELVLIFVCGLNRKLRFHPRKRFDPGIYEVDPYLHRVTPQSLDHLKQIAGLPNEVYAKQQIRISHGCAESTRMRCVDMHHLPVTDTIHFNRLSEQERVAVRDLSFNLLMGYADASLVEKAPYKAVVGHMLSQAASLPIFVGKDLLVCPDETVEFSGFAAIYFDNVVVVGNGKIVLGHHAKLHAYQIKHV